MDQIGAEPGADEKACDPDDCSGREAPHGNQLEHRSRMKETQRQQAHNRAGKEGDQGVGEHHHVNRCGDTGTGGGPSGRSGFTGWMRG